MNCTFDGRFTRREKASIIVVLAALEKAANLPHNESGPSWHVNRDEKNPESDDSGPLPLRIRHTETDVEFFGRSVEHLIAEIEEMTATQRR